MKQVMAFGESINDAKVVAEFLRPLLPKGVNVKPMGQPLVLVKADTDREKKMRGADKISAAVDIMLMKKKVVLVTIHRDCDRFEPHHIKAAEGIESYFGRKISCPPVVAAVPAWETEAWLMLFPDALREYRKCWRRLDLKGRHVGGIKNAKEFLRSALRPSGKSSGCKDYQPMDAPGIAQIAVKNINSVAGYSEARKASASFDRFVSRVLHCINSSS